MEYDVEVSLPQYFTLPKTVKIPLMQDDSVPWENPAGIRTYKHGFFCSCEDNPLTLYKVPSYLP